MSTALNDTLHELLASATMLRELGRWPSLQVTLSQALDRASTDPQSRAVLGEVLRVPDEVRRGTAIWQELCVRAWCANREPQAILDFTATVDLTLETAACRAWALVRTDQAAQGLALLEQQEFTGTPAVVGFAWRVRGQALAALHHEEWEEAFSRAGKLLTGRRRSLALAEQGHLLDRTGRGVDAREVWREALGGLEADVFHHAWLRFNLGVSAFRDGTPEAERHLLLLTELSRRAEARPFASRAWAGLGTVRRLHGEWDRAELAYRQAARLAGSDLDDAFQAQRGIAHVQRLRGLPELALEELGRALNLRSELSGEPSRPHWIYVDVAGCWAQLGEADRAAAALSQAGLLDRVDTERAALVRAELSRLNGDLLGAVALVRGLELRGDWVREERALYPALFALVSVEGAVKTTQADTARARVTQVSVWAAGVLRVEVNGREVPLSPTGRAGELLAALLELGGGASCEALVEWLFPDAPPKSRAARQALSAVVRSLRLALGWKASVQSNRGAYALDPQVCWEYDVAQLRTTGQPLPHFLDGIYSNWVRERQRPPDAD